MLDFETLLSPLQISIFRDEIMGQKYHLVRGTTERFGNLMTWQDLAQILLCHRLDHPRLRLVREGRTIPPSEFLETRTARRGDYFRRPNTTAVEQLMRSGAMLHLAAADELSLELSYLAESAERVLGSTCFINLHAGLRESRGFDTHWDGHEVCVLQIQGRKHWRVLGVTEKAPLAVPPDQKGDPPADVIWEGVLETGDLLYMPRGCWHSAVAHDEPSLHLSLGWENPTGGEFLAWLLRLQRDDLALREDGPVIGQENRAPDYLAKIQDHHRSLEWSEAYSAFLSQRRAEALRRRQQISLP